MLYWNGCAGPNPDGPVTIWKPFIPDSVSHFEREESIEYTGTPSTPSFAPPLREHDHCLWDIFKKHCDSSDS